MEWDPDSLENIYYAVGALVVAYLVFNGWRQGVVRQLMTLVAIASAYAVGIFGSGAVAPLFRFLRYPDPLPRIIGGAVAGLVTYLVISTVSRIFFKKTGEKPQGRARLNYGIFGAVLGLAFGLVLFFAASEAVRYLGAIAQPNLQAATSAGQNSHSADLPPAETSSLVTGLAKLSSALNSGGSGDFLKKMDPVPPNVFSTLAKLGMMVSRPEAVDRFLTYPGIDKLTNHPKLADLRTDPEVSRLIADQSYFRLLRHQKVVALAGDPEFAAEIRKMNFDEALEYALKTPAKEPRLPKKPVAPIPEAPDVPVPQPIPPTPASAPGN